MDGFVKAASRRSPATWERGSIALALASASIAVGGRALGANPSSGVRLAYVDRSGANCPTDASLRAAAVARLGYDPFTPSGRAGVSVTITRTARGLKGEIRVDDPAREGSASRAIESSSGDCAELGKAMALAISIAVDAMHPPSSAGDGSSPGPHDRAQEAAGASARSTVDSQDEHLVPPAVEPELLGDGSIASDIPRKPRVPVVSSDDGESRWRVSLNGLTSVGFGPGVTAGGALGVGWVGQNESIEVEARADYPQSAAHGAGSISVWPLLFTVAPCIGVRGWAFCGLGRVGSLHGSGHGFGTDLSGWSMVSTVGARLANEAILTKPLRFRVFFDLDWIATTNSFDVDHRSAWATSTWAISLGLGLTTRFP
jgi:hypothetical protein